MSVEPIRVQRNSVTIFVSHINFEEGKIFKVIDLGAISEEKFNSYSNAQRFVRMIENSDQTREIHISPQVLNQEKIRQVLQNLTLDDKVIGKVKVNVSTQEDYDMFFDEINDDFIAIEAEKNEASKKDVAKDAKTNEVVFYSVSKYVTSVKFAFVSVGNSLKGVFSQCTNVCIKKICERYFESQARIEAAEEEAAKVKFLKKKQLRKEEVKLDMEQQEVKLDLVKQGLRANFEKIVKKLNAQPVIM